MSPTQAKAFHKAPDSGQVTPVDPYLVANFFRAEALNDVFATHAKDNAPTIDAYETRD